MIHTANGNCGNHVIEDRSVESPRRAQEIGSGLIVFGLGLRGGRFDRLGLCNITQFLEPPQNCDPLFLGVSLATTIRPYRCKQLVQ